VDGPVIFVQGARAEIRGFDGCANDVRFADPGALDVWEDDGDEVVMGLEGAD
jgi:hypothetical protein